MGDKSNKTTVVNGDMTNCTMELEDAQLHRNIRKLDNPEIVDSEDEDSGEDLLRNALRHRTESEAFVKRDELIDMLLLPKRPNTVPGNRKQTKSRPDYKDDLLQILLPDNTSFDKNSSFHSEFSARSSAQISDQTSLMESIQISDEFVNHQNILKELNNRELKNNTSSSDISRYSEEIVKKKLAREEELIYEASQDINNQENLTERQDMQDSDEGSSIDEEIVQIDINQFQSDKLSESFDQSYKDQIIEYSDESLAFSKICNLMTNTNSKQERLGEKTESTQIRSDNVQESIRPDVITEPIMTKESDLIAPNDIGTNNAVHTTKLAEFMRSNKRKSTLTKLRENQIPYRVGLSKRAKIGHLHSYLKKK